MSETLLLNKEETASLLDLPACIQEMKKVFCAISEKKATMLPRGMLPTSAQNLFAVMPALNEESGLCTAKVIVFPGGHAKESAQGILPLFSAEDGSLKAIVEAQSLTAARTAAASAAATDLLAAKNAQRLALLGAGRLAEAHLQAIRQVRPIKTVYLWARSEEKGRAFCEAHSEPGLELIFCDSVKQAVQNAQIICTLTKSAQPLLKGEWVPKGAHINAVGACSADAREVDTACVQKARVFCDERGACLQDAGDLLIPIEEGCFTPAQIAGEVGEAALGRIAGRETEEEVTLFESVGLSAEDLAAAELVYRFAKQRGAGTAFCF